MARTFMIGYYRYKMRTSEEFRSKKFRQRLAWCVRYWRLNWLVPWCEFGWYQFTTDYYLGQKQHFTD